MSQYFKNFPLVNYYFGDETNPTIFQNISAYISIIDELKDKTTSYTSVFIEEGDRPDTLSYKLYGTTDYYWTFFFLNDDIRESGWPLSWVDLLDKAKKDYPHFTVTTEDDISSRFLEGDLVQGLQSGSTGTVIKRYLDLGQIVVNMSLTATTNGFNAGEQIRANNIISDEVVVKSSVAQYNSVHHFENTSGEWKDIDPYDYDNSTSGLIPVTYYERVIAKNEALKEIKVFRPDVVPQIQGEYQKLLLRG